MVKCMNMANVRAKAQNGRIVAKRSDTKISTIEKQYGVDLGVRGDMKLGTYLREKGYPSLSRMFEK